MFLLYFSRLLFSIIIYLQYEDCFSVFVFLYQIQFYLKSLCVQAKSKKVEFVVLKLLLFYGMEILVLNLILYFGYVLQAKIYIYIFFFNVCIPRTKFIQSQYNSSNYNLAKCMEWIKITMLSISLIIYLVKRQRLTYIIKRVVRHDCGMNVVYMYVYVYV